MTNDREKTLDEMAIAIHEIFLAYVRAGFTEPQALEIIKTHIAAGGAVGGAKEA